MITVLTTTKMIRKTTTTMMMLAMIMVMTTTKLATVTMIRNDQAAESPANTPVENCTS